MDESEITALLQEWERRCRVNTDTHAWAERRLDRLNAACAVISVGSMVALGVIASGFDLTKGSTRYLVVALSVVAALVTVVATVRNYGLEAAAHRNASRQYGALRREIEAISVEWQDRPDQIKSHIDEIRRRWDWVADIAPNAPRRVRERAENKLNTSAIWNRSVSSGSPSS